MSTVGIFGKQGSQRVQEMARILAKQALAAGWQVMAEHQVTTEPTVAGVTAAAPAAVAAAAELAVVLGGDGTLIRVVRLLDERTVPVFGVHMGALGYLTEFTVDEAPAELARVLAGDVRTEKRNRLRVRLLRQGRSQHQARVLNDVVVNISGMSRIIEIRAFLGGERITTYRADGLIVATPTGSTAYSLSAGGPILMPQVPAVVLTPICPHTLTMRPLVLPDNVEITLEVIRGADGVQATFDGQEGLPLESGDRLLVDRSPGQVELVCPPRNTFQILRTKLKWGQP